MATNERVKRVWTESDITRIKTMRRAGLAEELKGAADSDDATILAFVTPTWDGWRKGAGKTLSAPHLAAARGVVVMAAKRWIRYLMGEVGSPNMLGVSLFATFRECGLTTPSKGMTSVEAKCTDSARLLLILRDAGLIALRGDSTFHVYVGGYFGGDAGKSESGRSYVGVGSGLK